MNRRRMALVASILAFAFAGLSLSGCSIIGSKTLTPNDLLEGEHIIYSIYEDDVEEGRNADFSVTILRDGKAVTYYSNDDMVLGDLQGMPDEEITELILDKVAERQAMSYWWIREQYGDASWPGPQEIVNAVAGTSQVDVGFMSSSDDYSALYDDGCSNLEDGYAASYMVWGQQKTVDEVVRAFEKECRSSVDRQAVEDSIVYAVNWAAECVADESKAEEMCDYNFAEKLVLYTETTIVPLMRENIVWADMSVGLTPDATGNAVQSEALYDSSNMEGGGISIYMNSALNPLDGQDERSIQGLEVYDSFYRFAWTDGSTYYALRYPSRGDSAKTVFALDDLDLKNATIWN